MTAPGLPALPLRLVIFDCDGVLVDSEALSREVIAAEAARMGLAFTEDAARQFTGLRWTDLQPVLEGLAGRTLPPDWPIHMQNLLIAHMHGRLRAIPGAANALRAVTAAGLPFRVASNSSHAEMAEKFAETGLAALVGERKHSAKDVGVGKPDPALFLAAATAEGVPAGACLVIEDSIPGVTAAHAAGMACLALVPEGDTAPFMALGARPIRSFAELPGILRDAMLQRAA